MAALAPVRGGASSPEGVAGSPAPASKPLAGHSLASAVGGEAGCPPVARVEGPRTKSRRRIALALGSGSIHGLAHIGVLRALERNGVRPALIVGTSAGAIVGVLASAGMSSAEIERAAAGFDWQQAGRLSLSARGLMTNEPLRQHLDAVLGGRSIEALPTSFAAIATDARGGDTVVLRSGSAALAVAASSAIPVLYSPVSIGGRELVDGSLTAPVPVDAARELGADFVIAVDVAYRPYDEPASGISGMAFQMMHIMVNALIDEQVRRADYGLRLELHALMRGDWNAATLIDAGDRAMQRDWPSLRSKLTGSTA